ncbi:hypothetical protein RCH11_003593 [Glaciihabitans sp. GrIS 2.15]|nr:hypothetical protein [Glaciihabitans sp. GrIS 2.15]
MAALALRLMNRTHEQESEVQVVEANTGIHRVERRSGVIGFVQHSGERSVSLIGPVFNTSIEVERSLTMGSAVAEARRNS